MTSIKRILRETSYKILGKMGACRSGSHSLNNSKQTIAHSSTIVSSKMIKRTKANETTNLSQATSAKRTKSKSRQHKSSKKSCNKHLSAAHIPEALLIASKNYLPPVQFHHVHGPNVQLAKNKFVARRTQSFCQALVFSNRVILPNERVYIKVLEIAKGWSGTIRFGFTSVDPATLRYQMPKHACPDMTNEGHTWARALADEVIKRNSVIHFSYNTNGFIHYGINNQDCGIFHANVNTSQNLWFIVDIYGLTAAVELIDPRIHTNATSDLDISHDDEEVRGGGGGTMFKSTSAMDELLMGQHLAMRSNKQKKRSRKRQTAQETQAALLYHHHQARNNTVSLGRHHSPEGVILPSGHSIGFGAHQAVAARSLLPNLSSVMLPLAQQNIYSPMPMVSNNRPEHDYYQIMTNTTPSSHRPAGQLHNSSLISNPAAAFNSSSISNEASANNTGRRGATRRSRSAATGDEQAEICQQLSSLQIQHSDNTTAAQTVPVLNSKQQYSAFKSPSSSTNNKLTSSSSHPVAAARRRLQSSMESGSSQKEQHSASSSGAQVGPSSSSSSSSASSSGAKAKARQSSVKSSTTLKSTASRDNQQSPQQAKDCPICFERPINCVLYQCGHMCTCYECGVKQWRTQQRTCPICRTIIKDVIKTYMS